MNQTTNSLANYAIALVIRMTRRSAVLACTSQTRRHAAPHLSVRNTGVMRVRIRVQAKKTATRRMCICRERNLESLVTDVCTNSVRRVRIRFHAAVPLRAPLARRMDSCFA